MYKRLLRPILFLFPAEKAHHITIRFLQIICGIPGKLFVIKKLFQVKSPSLEQEFAGLKFPNPVGLAAGFDKDAKVVPAWDALGFGFIEIGTITPLAQPGNPKPRLFRLKNDKAIINRMGFNNDGVEAAVRRLKKARTKAIIGGNIGKNKVTPNEDAFSDYLQAFERLYPVVDYFVVNVSSPNTPGLRELQEKEPLKKILIGLKKANKQKVKEKPILLKIAPDLSTAQLDDIVEIVLETAIEGLIATNTTISREGLSYSRQHIENIGAGGLSGQPLSGKSDNVISYLRSKLGSKILIIGVGGIMSAEDAVRKINAGANLVQLYTGFIYEGPSLIRTINKKLIGTFNQ